MTCPLPLNPPQSPFFKGGSIVPLFGKEGGAGEIFGKFFGKILI